MKRILMAVVTALGLMAGHAQAQGFSDTWFGVRNDAFVANPGGGKGDRDVNKVVFSAGNFDVWDYGTNFFNADVLLSNPNEPAFNSAGGSTEFYGVYRAQLSPDKIFGISTSFGPVKAVNFEIGGDLETENTFFAPNKKLLVAGPNFNIGLPAGFLNIGVHISKEWNHNGICASFSGCVGTSAPNSGDVSFHATPEFEFVWLYSLQGLTGLPLDFRGFMNVVAPKGKDGFGNQTAWEVLAVPRLNLDLGTLMFHKPHKPDLFLALELWQNKFGNKSDTTPGGTEQVAPEIGIEMHF